MGLKQWLIASPKLPKCSLPNSINANIYSYIQLVIQFSVLKTLMLEWYWLYGWYLRYCDLHHAPIEAVLCACYYTTTDNFVFNYEISITVNDCEYWKAECLSKQIAKIYHLSNLWIFMYFSSWLCEEEHHKTSGFWHYAKRAGEHQPGCCFILSLLLLICRGCENRKGVGSKGPFYYTVMLYWFPYVHLYRLCCAS